MCNFFNSISAARSALHAVYGCDPTVPRQRPRLIAKQVFHPAQLFWQSAAPYDRFRDIRIVLNLLGVHRFPHIEINAKTTHYQHAKYLARYIELYWLRHKPDRDD